MIAVKVAKRRSVEKRDEKEENEKNIIKLFKNGVSGYVLKYYVSSQANFEHKDSLLLDYLPNSHPLSNFIEIYSHTLSLNSKAFLIVNLANSLRFINDYQIAHMDLNLNNVLVYRDYLTKLIDFGEAYSPNLSISEPNQFKRGYTFPFCPPEYF
jgi:serine/threonine protein kinase